VRVISLGCGSNIAESETIRALLAGEEATSWCEQLRGACEAVRQTRQADPPPPAALFRRKAAGTGCAADIEREQLAACPRWMGSSPNAKKLDARAWNVADAPSPCLRP